MIGDKGAPSWTPPESAVSSPAKRSRTRRRIVRSRGRWRAARRLRGQGAGAARASTATAKPSRHNLPRRVSPARPRRRTQPGPLACPRRGPRRRARPNRPHRVSSRGHRRAHCKSPGVKMARTIRTIAWKSRGFTLVGITRQMPQCGYTTRPFSRLGCTGIVITLVGAGFVDDGPGGKPISPRGSCAARRARSRSLRGPSTAATLVHRPPVAAELEPEGLCV